MEDDRKPIEVLLAYCLIRSQPQKFISTLKYTYFKAKFHRYSFNQRQANVTGRRNAENGKKCSEADQRGHPEVAFNNERISVLGASA